MSSHRAADPQSSVFGDTIPDDEPGNARATPGPSQISPPSTPGASQSRDEISRHHEKNSEQLTPENALTTNH
ncbi:hypothetical protein Dda_1066 [Drechslerella dactyloides]|uniref:Uncharacterized protein n=1 Tax=Drechslerella dactyloides TaxID=74499 RepID=A0AAD6J5F1_DREDA|nr:hypothetical protein Dda_1066 [Drechslerella dactyloides]